MDENAGIEEETAGAAVEERHDLLAKAAGT
jgi:hypothetical protein